MKNKLLYVITLLSFFLVSCEEDFNPFGEFQEKYVLNCVLRGDTTLQVAAVSRAYTTGSFNPFDNASDPFIGGAEVRVWFGDSVYLFKDTVITREDSSRYNSPMHVYKSDRFEIIPDRPIEIEVLLPDGRRVNAESRTAGRIDFLSNGSTNIPGSSNSFNLGWNTLTAGIYFYPRFTIIYYKKEGSEFIRHELEVPQRYEGDTPVYFKPSRETNIFIAHSTILKALRSISEGDPAKSNYSIELKPVIKIAAFDDALSKYYSTSSQSFESLSVRLDENDYSNVEGGYGIFGSFTSTRYENIKIFNTFVTDLGYIAIE